MGAVWKKEHDVSETVTRDSTPAEVARAFTEAWTSGDMAAAAAFVAEGVVFDGPLGHVEGKGAYFESLKGLSRGMDVTGVRVIAAYGDDAQALIMYELVTGRFGALTCAKLLTVRAGRIESDRLTFDSYAVRMGQ